MEISNSETLVRPSFDTLSETLMAEVVRSTRDLYFQETLHYGLPFPMGVFGTLRNMPKSQGNGTLMLGRNRFAIAKAFLPHTVTKGINLQYSQGSSAAFEVYFYDPDDWKDLIVNIDHLEGFNPNLENHFYIRTLMKLRLLPTDFNHQFYNQNISSSVRDLQIPEKEWSLYPAVPAWVYSNKETNAAMQLNRGVGEYPLLW